MLNGAVQIKLQMTVLLTCRYCSDCFGISVGNGTGNIQVYIVYTREQTQPELTVISYCLDG